MNELSCDDCKFSGRCGNGELHFRNRGYVCNGFVARGLNPTKPANTDCIKSKSMTLCAACIKSEPYQKSFICAEYGGIWEPGDGCTHGVKKAEGGHA